MNDYIRALDAMNEWILEKWSDPGRLISCQEIQQKIEELKYDEITYQERFSDLSRRLDNSESHGGVPFSELP